MNNFTEGFKKNFWKAFYEYLLIMLPISIYVLLEANHKYSISYFFTSPEWAVGTIFLVFTSTFTYYKDVIKDKDKLVNEHLLNLYPLIGIITTVLATLNAHWSMSGETNWLIFGRILLLIFSTIFFFLLMTKPDESK
jgi:hypothetical protein